MTRPTAIPAAQSRYTVSVVRTFDEMAQVQTVRSLVYMADQACPYDEEFDGNDLCGATHLLLRWAAVGSPDLLMSVVQLHIRSPHG